MAKAQVHETAVLIGDVHLGDDVEILPYTVIYGPASIGDGARIGPHAVIGTAAQHRDHLDDRTHGVVRVGARTTIREHVSVHRPCNGDFTVIGDDVIVMAGAVINHDCIVEDRVIITANVALAGMVFVMHDANIGQSASVHQRTVIGAHAMVAMGSVVRRSVPPFVRHIDGQPHVIFDKFLERSEFAAHREAIAGASLGGRTPEESPLVELYSRYAQLKQATGRNA